VRTVVLKLSGDALRTEPEGGDIGSRRGDVISVTRLDYFAAQIARALANRHDLRVGVVVGGGNILRGRELPEMDEVIADHMGMLATILNSLAVKDSLRRAGLETRVMSGLDIRGVAEAYIYERARKHLERGRVIVFAGGTGNPFVTTDFAAALRARELKAHVLLVAKNGTDGVYDKDPNSHLDAQRFSRLSFDEMISRDLEVMDVSAVQQCKEGLCPLFVFDIDAEDALFKALIDELPDFGTWVTAELIPPSAPRSAASR
jgi:uridylate kinase